MKNLTVKLKNILKIETISFFVLFFFRLKNTEKRKNREPKTLKLFPIINFPKKCLSN